MFKKMCIIMGLAACFYGAKAQNIEFENGPSHTYVMGHSGSTDCHLVFRNLTGGTANFLYRKIQDDYPSQWWVSFCDNINCYATLIDQDTFAPVPDSGYAEFKVTVSPNGKADTSTVKYEIYAVETPGEKDTVSFTFIVQWGASNKEFQSNSLNLFPNPATDVIHLSNVADRSKLEIYSANGSLVRSELLRAGNQAVSVSDLPAGFYFAGYSDNTGIKRGSFVKK